MDLVTRHDVYSASVTPIVIYGHKMWHLEILEGDELIFDFNGSFEDCIDWLNRLGRRSAATTTEGEAS